LCRANANSRGGSRCGRCTTRARSVACGPRAQICKSATSPRSRARNYRQGSRPLSARWLGVRPWRCRQADGAGSRRCQQRVDGESANLHCGYPVLPRRHERALSECSAGGAARVWVDDLFCDRAVGRGILDESQNAVRHEPRSADWRASARYFCHLDDASTGVDLHPSAIPCRGNLVRSDIVACVDHDLDPITSHGMTVPPGQSSPAGRRACRRRGSLADVPERLREQSDLFAAVLLRGGRRRGGRQCVPTLSMGPRCGTAGPRGAP
jgi:hypothetical protein